MADIPTEVVQAAAEALRTKQWGSRPSSAHASHKFHMDCEICHGNLAAMAEVALEAAASFIAGVGSPASCPSAAPESTQSPETTAVAPVYPPGPVNPTETLSALHALARVRELAERWRHISDRKNGPRAALLAALDGAGAVPEHTAPATTEETANG